MTQAKVWCSGCQRLVGVMFKEERSSVFERGRRYGAKQALRFLAEMHDLPSVAEDIEQYVLPNRNWRKTFWQLYHQETAELTQKRVRAETGRLQEGEQ